MHGLTRLRVLLGHRATIATVVAMVVSALYFLVGLGFRGITPASLEFLNRSREAAHTLRGSGDWSALLAGAHPGPELVAGLALLVWPGSDLQALWLLSSLSITAGLPAVAILAMRVTSTQPDRPNDPRAAALIAMLLFVGAPLSAALAATAAVTSMVVTAWAWLLVLATRPHHGWKATTALSMLTAFLLLGWAPVVLWFALWLVVSVARQPNAADMPESLRGPGLIPTSSITPALVIVPVAAIAIATAVHPGFWSGIIDGWTSTGLAVITASPEPVLYRAEIFPPTRLPLTSGITYFMYLLPPVLIVAALLGLVLGPLDRLLSPARRPSSTSILAWTLPLLAVLPWMSRSPAYGQVDTLAMALPILCAFAGFAIVRVLGVLEAFVTRRSSSPRARPVSLAAVLLLLLAPPFIETLRIHPHQGSYYNWFAGQLPGAVERGFPKSRDAIVPVQLVADLDRHAPESALYPGELEALFVELVAAGHLPAQRLTPSIGDAAATIGRYHDFTPHSPRSAHHVSRGMSADGFQHVVQGVPVFLVNRR